MKNKIKIVAMATSIVSAVALIGGTLVMPVFAADDFSKGNTTDFECEIGECEICGTWYTIRIDDMEIECPNKANHPTKTETPVEPTEQPTEPVTPVEPTEQPTEPVTPVEPTEQPTEPVTPVEPTEQPTEPVTPTEPTITYTNMVSEFSKGEIIISFELPDDYEDTEITAPVDIEKLEAEAAEARRLANEAQAEADRLEAIALEKEAALEAARQ